MIAVCTGQWTEDAHALALLDEREPYSNPEQMEVACDRCAQSMGAKIRCHGCHRADTQDGLCEMCEQMLGTHVGGEPIVELTIYRTGVSPVLAQYDGAGMITRLRRAQQHPLYAGFRLRRLAVAAS